MQNLLLNAITIKIVVSAVVMTQLRSNEVDIKNV